MQAYPECGCGRDVYQPNQSFRCIQCDLQPRSGFAVPQGRPWECHCAPTRDARIGGELRRIADALERLAPSAERLMGAMPHEEHYPDAPVPGCPRCGADR